MTTCLGKSCSFGLPRVPFVNCCQFMYLVISLLVLKAGCGIWLYQFLIIAYLFILIHSDYTFSMFTLCYLVLRGTFQSQKTHVLISSKIMFLWWVKVLTLYEVGIYHYFDLLELEPTGFNSWTSVAPVIHHWSCCWVLILFHLSVESWFICRYFDSLISRSPPRESNIYMFMKHSRI